MAEPLPAPPPAGGAARLNRTRLAAARLRAADAQPFLALALYALSPVPAPGLGTFGVDEQWRLFVDPERLETWSVDELAGVLLHEVGHVVRDHGGRARTAGVGDGEQRAWNLAADAEINQALAKVPNVVLPDAVFPASLGLAAGYLAEWYYARLLAEGIPPDLPDHDCGTGCHGVGSVDPPVEPAGGSPLPRGLSDPEALLLRRRIAQEVVRLAGRHPGSVPGQWTRWAEAVLEPVLDWRRLLAGAIRSGVATVAGAADYSYSRPSRRRVPRVVLPSMVRPRPRVAVVIDTSGSMDADQLGQAWSEVQGCFRQLGVRRDLLTVYAVDTAAHRVAAGYGRRASLPGGGGTDLRVGVQAATSARPAPDLVVVVTDGFTPWPADKPRARVVVALLERGGPGARVADPPPWARTVRVPPAP